MFLSLLWKEWKENLWKLLFCGSVSLAFTGLLFRMRIVPDEANCVLISMVQAFVVPIVYSLDIFSGEMSNRTIHLLFKIPVERWKLFFSKYLVCIGGMCVVFLLTGGLMEIVSGGREMGIWYLLKINAFHGIVGLLLFTWFCPFGCQSRSEAGSLAAMSGVMMGFGIVCLWGFMCNVDWALFFVPYIFILSERSHGVSLSYVGVGKVVISQVLAVAVVLSIGCLRYAKIRRCL